MGERQTESQSNGRQCNVLYRTRCRDNSLPDGQQGSGVVRLIRIPDSDGSVQKMEASDADSHLFAHGFHDVEDAVMSTASEEDTIY